MAKKQSNSKVLQMIISSLDENRNERMLSWTTREKGEFKIIFVHKSSPNWDTGFISLFEDVDKISEKKYMKYQKKKEYESDCKFRFKSNLIKLQKCGALKSLRERDKKINKSIQEKHYRILKDFSGKSALKPKMKINENINMDTFTEEESVRRNNEVSIVNPVEIPSKDQSHCLCLSKQVSALMIADTISNKISGGSEKNVSLNAKQGMEFLRDVGANFEVAEGYASVGGNPRVEFSRDVGANFEVAEGYASVGGNRGVEFSRDVGANFDVTEGYASIGESPGVEFSRDVGANFDVTEGYASIGESPGVEFSRDVGANFEVAGGNPGVEFSRDIGANFDVTEGYASVGGSPGVECSRAVGTNFDVAEGCASVGGSPGVEFSRDVGANFEVAEGYASVGGNPGVEFSRDVGANFDMTEGYASIGESPGVEFSRDVGANFEVAGGSPGVEFSRDIGANFDVTEGYASLGGNPLVEFSRDVGANFVVAESYESVGGSRVLGFSRDVGANFDASEEYATVGGSQEDTVFSRGVGTNFDMAESYACVGRHPEVRFLSDVGADIDGVVENSGVCNVSSCVPANQGIDFPKYEVDTLDFPSKKTVLATNQINLLPENIVNLVMLVACSNTYETVPGSLVKQLQWFEESIVNKVNEPLVNTEYTGIENAYNGESVLKEQGIQLFSKDIENESLVNTENAIMEDTYIGKKQGIQQFSKDIENESFVNTENAITGSTHSDEDVCKEQEILKNFKDIENKIVKTVSVFDKFCNDVPKITELAALKVDNGQLVKPSLACNPCDTMQQTKPGNEVFATPANYFLPFLCHDVPEQFPQDYENTFHYSPENNDSRMESHLNYPLDCMDFMKGELSLDIKDMLHDECMDSSNVFSNMKGSRDPFLSSSFSWGTNETMDFEFPEAEILQHLMDEKQFKLEDLQFFN